MIFKLTMDFIQHLIHQHCCTRTWAHAKHDGATAELNRSKNPILISPAWIVSFVALDAWVKSCFLALPKWRRGMEKKLDNERYNTSASERIQCVLLDCAYFVLCVFETLANLAHTPLQTDMQSETHNHTVPLELYFKSFFISHIESTSWKRCDNLACCFSWN